MSDNTKNLKNVVANKTHIFKNGFQSATNYVQNAIENVTESTQDATQNLVNNVIRTRQKEDEDNK